MAIIIWENMTVSGNFNREIPSLSRTVRAYKHVPDEYADAFLNGTSIQLGTFRSFENIENGRADSFDGAVTTLIKEYRTESLSLDEASILNSVGFAAPPGVALNLQDASITMRLKNAYVFCASLEPDFSRTGEKVFEISDLQRFAQLVRFASRLYLGAPQVQQVDYEDRHVVRSSIADVVSPSPFVKDPRFSGEREVRIMWPVFSERDPFIQIACIRASRLIKLIS